MSNVMNGIIILHFSYKSLPLHVSAWSHKKNNIKTSQMHSAFPFYHCYPSLAENFDMIIIMKIIENDDDDKNHSYTVTGCKFNINERRSTSAYKNEFCIIGGNDFGWKKLSKMLATVDGKKSIFIWILKLNNSLVDQFRKYVTPHDSIIRIHNISNEKETSEWRQWNSKQQQWIYRII